MNTHTHTHTHTLIGFEPTLRRKGWRAVATHRRAPADAGLRTRTGDVERRPTTTTTTTTTMLFVCLFVCLFDCLFACCVARTLSLVNDDGRRTLFLLLGAGMQSRPRDCQSNNQRMLCFVRVTWLFFVCCRIFIIYIYIYITQDECARIYQQTESWHARKSMHRFVSFWNIHPLDSSPPNSGSIGYALRVAIR
jgi:hypothetical protein